MYTWGASPQLIRLMNQARKRARMAQKFEGTKTTTANETGSNIADQNCSDFNQNFTKESTNESMNRDREKNFKNGTHAIDDTSLPIGDETGDSDNNQNSIAKDDELIENQTDKDSLIIDKISNLPSAANLEERIRKFLKAKTSSSQVIVDNSSMQPETSQKENSKNGSNKPTEDFEDECTEHLYPNEVDSSNVNGEIIQVTPLSSS